MLINDRTTCYNLPLVFSWVCDENIATRPAFIELRLTIGWRPGFFCKVALGLVWDYIGATARIDILKYRWILRDDSVLLRQLWPAAAGQLESSHAYEAPALDVLFLAFSSPTASFWKCQVDGPAHFLAKEQMFSLNLVKWSVFLTEKSKRRQSLLLNTKSPRITRRIYREKNGKFHFPQSAPLSITRKTLENLCYKSTRNS